MEELRAQGLPLKAAARQAAGEFGVPKNQLYDLALRNSPLSLTFLFSPFYYVL